MIRLQERALTGKHLEMRIWDIWSYVRENQNSLDSERACKIVHEIITAAVSDVQRRLEETAAELDRERRSGRKSAEVEKVPVSACYSFQDSHNGSRRTESTHSRVSRNLCSQ